MDREQTGFQVTCRGSGHRENVGSASIEWLANSELTPGSEMTLGHVVLERDGSNRQHFHPNCHELVFVVKGTVQHDVGNETVTLPEGSALHISTKEIHKVRNIGRGPAELIVVFSSERRETVFTDEDPQLP